MAVGNSFFGMDVRQVESVAGSLTGQAERINRVLTQLTNTLNSTPWTGPDRDKFVREWAEVHVPAIRRAAEEIVTTVSRVRSDISLQVKASTY